MNWPDPVSVAPRRGDCALAAGAGGSNAAGLIAGGTATVELVGGTARVFDAAEDTRRVVGHNSR